MKKITLLLSFVACVLLAQGQNMLVNPSFESWKAGVPTGWTVTTTVGAVFTQVATTDPGQTGSAIQVAGPTGTMTLQQAVNIVPTTGTTFDTNTTYKFSVSYLATAGDGADARVWSAFITSAVGVTPVAYLAIPTTHADSVALYNPFHGPGGNLNPATGNDTNGYLLDNRASGIWHTYNYSFKFPAGVTQFNFAVRTYKASTVIWDNFYFGPDLGSNLNALSADKSLSVSVTGNNLSVGNVADGSTVDVYSTLGAKVQSSKLESGSIQLNDLSKGLYIVRVGNATAKIKF
jgi:hypothetical protein